MGAGWDMEKPFGRAPVAFALGSHFDRRLYARLRIRLTLRPPREGHVDAPLSHLLTMTLLWEAIWIDISMRV